MIKISKVKTRAEFLFPWINTPMIDRLRAAGAVDLRNNHIVTDLGNGYIRITAINPNKKY
jgi:hypothetical protein